MPKQILSSSQPAAHGWGQQLLRALYFSLGSFDTFQTFDLTPKTNWLRMVVAIEGLIGISMITASISWLVLLYPALARSRQFAKRISVLVEAEQRTGLSVVCDLGMPVLLELAQSVLQFRIDVVLFPILLNFYATERESTIAYVLPHVHRIACESVKSQLRDVRLGGEQLKIALENLSKLLRERVVQTSSDDVQAVFKAFMDRET